MNCSELGPRRTVQVNELEPLYYCCLLEVCYSSGKERRVSFQRWRWRACERETQATRFKGSPVAVTEQKSEL